MLSHRKKIVAGARVLIFCAVFGMLIGMQAVKAGKKSERIKGEVLNQEEFQKLGTRQGNEKVRITPQKQIQTLKNENNVDVLLLNTVWPSVEIVGRPESAKRINQQLLEQKNAFLSQKDEILSYAKDDYNNRSRTEQRDWNGYSIYLDYLNHRADSKIISFDVLKSQYTGGAHPDTNHFGLNYQTNTGEQLRLEDISKDEKAFRERVAQILTRTAKQDRYQDYWLPDYEKYMDQLLAEDTWLLTDQGFVVICNPYLISPYAAGTLYFVIPYSMLPELRSQYRV